MASLCKNKAGGWRVLLVCPDGKRRTIRLPDCPKREAQNFKGLVETLAHFRATGAFPDAETRSRVGRLTDTIRKRLEAVGLVDPTKDTTLGEYVAGYIAKRKGNIARIPSWASSMPKRR